MTHPNRRRFLALAAAATAFPAMASPVRWQGYALGAEVSLTLHAPRRQAESALRDVRMLLGTIERLFSLYDPGSAISRLNDAGLLRAPDPGFSALLRLCDQLHRATGGVFDPAIQSRWLDFARGRAGPRHIGWEGVRHSTTRVRLAPGQALTFNGIAQGFATDLARKSLFANGLSHALVNIGEFVALGGPFRLGIADPDLGLVRVVSLENRARSTSSPGAMTLVGGQAHILHPDGRAPLWSTVSVEADSAAIADGASTAFCVMSEAEITETLGHLPGRPIATLIAADGDVRQVG